VARTLAALDALIVGGPDAVELDIEPALPGMASYLDRARALKRHPHNYSLEMFGLSPAMVRERMQGYIERFDVPMEKSLVPPSRRRAG
jgi:hypothetical protein